jgi:hypothetical protein
MVVQPAQRTRGVERAVPQGPEPLSFGPGSVPQLKTDVVRLIDKTDRLSDVMISYHCTLRGEDLADHGDLVGLGGEEPGDADLMLSWTLREAPVANRDELRELLSRLPHPLICEVRVRLKREKG